MEKGTPYILTVKSTLPISSLMALSEKSHPEYFLHRRL
jgi:hypothetical protein